MATRMYMPTAQSAPSTTFPINSNWNSVCENAVYQPLAITIPAVDRVSGEYTFLVSESDPAIHDQLCGQWISPPLLAQTISGSISGIWSPREANSAYDFGTQVSMRVCDYYGTLTRGTLLSPFTYTTTVATAGIGNREFPSAGSNLTRFLPGGGGPIPLALNVQLGDRIVWEIGARATNLIATTRTADPRLQLRSDWSDAAWVEGTSGSGVNHWIEFTDDLTFDPDYDPAVDAVPFVGWGVPI